MPTPHAAAPLLLHPVRMAFVAACTIAAGCGGGASESQSQHPTAAYSFQSDGTSQVIQPATSTTPTPGPAATPTTTATTTATENPTVTATTAPSTAIATTTTIHLDGTGLRDRWAPGCTPKLYDDFVDNDSWTNRRLLPADCARVRTVAPVFSWTQPLNRDTSVPWVFELRRTDTGQVVLRTESDVPRLAMHQALPRGSYVWTVEYRHRRGQAVTSAPRRFSVDAESAQVVFPSGAQFAQLAARHPHPRLLPAGSSFAAIAAAAASSPFHTDALTALIREADAALATPLPTPDSAAYGGSVATYDDKLDKTALRRVVDQERRFIEATGLAAGFTGDARYRVHGVSRLLQLAQWSPSGPTSESNLDYANREIYRALGQGLTLFWNELNNSQKSKIANAMKARIAQAMDRFQGLDRAPYNSHVDVIIWSVLEALLNAAGAQQFPEATEWLDRTWELVQTTANTWGDDDGGFGNGVAYGWYRLSHIARVMAAVHVATGVNLGKHPWIERFGDYLLAMTSPGGGHSSAFGDAAHVTTHYHAFAGDQFLLYAALTRKPHHSWYATAVQTSTRVRYVEPWHLMFLGAGVRAAEPRAPHAQVWRFADAGVVAFHSDTASAERSSLFFRSSEFGSLSHSYADQNAFTFVSRGRDLLISAGYYPYYLSPHHSAVTRATRYKNALTFDGGTGQAENGTTRVPMGTRDARGTLLNVGQSPDWAVATGDATLAYRRYDPSTKEWTPVLTNAVRSVAYNPNAGVAIVYDWADSPTRRRWELNFNAPTPFSTNGRRAAVSNAGASACIDIYGPQGAFTAGSGFHVPSEDGSPDQYNARYATSQTSTLLVAVSVIREDCRAVAVSVTFEGTQATVRVGDAPQISFERRTADVATRAN